MRGFVGSGEQFGGLWPATIWHNINQGYLDAVKPDLPPFPTCPDPGRGGRPAAGAADPYGTLNGGKDGFTTPTVPRAPLDPAAEGEAPADTPATEAPAPDPNGGQGQGNGAGNGGGNGAG